MNNLLLLGIGLTVLTIIIIQYNPDKPTGYSCEDNECVLTHSGSQFTTKEACEQFCKEKELTKSSQSTEDRWKCDKSNCTCVNDTYGPYTSLNECRYDCDSCMIHPHLYYPQSLLRPRVQYSAFPIHGFKKRRHHKRLQYWT